MPDGHPVNAYIGVMEFWIKTTKEERIKADTENLRHYALKDDMVEIVTETNKVFYAVEMSVSLNELDRALEINKCFRSNYSG